MRGQHLTALQVDSLLRREIPRPQMFDMLVHLEDCGDCSRHVEQAIKTSIGRTARLSPFEKTTRLLDYSGAVISAVDKLASEFSSMKQHRETVPAQVAKLLSLSSSHRRLIIANDSRFHSWALTEGVVAASRAIGIEDPEEGADLAEVAVELAAHLPVEGFRGKLCRDLEASAWASLGNSLRVQTDFAAAARAFERAKDCLAKGSGDPLDKAQLLDLESSLLRELRDFSASEHKLDEAIRGYRVANERHLEGRALVKLAKLYTESGRAEESLPLLDRAACLIDVEREPALALILQENRLDHLSEAGRLDEAERLLPEVRSLIKTHGSRTERLRLLWIEARLRHRLGQIELADQMLWRAREGFLAAKSGYEVALVSLDIAALYLEQGRAGDVRALIVETLPQITARNIHREALMAWTLLRQAVEQETVTLGLLDEIASRVREAQGHSSTGS